MNASGLDRASAFAAQHGTTQLLVLERGEVALERSWDATPADAADVFAVQKGVVAILIGVAREAALLDLDDRMNDHLAPGWTRLAPSEEAKLTLRHLMTMTTGMDDDLGPLGEVGVSWRYNNTAYNYLKKVLEVRSGQSLNELTRAWLTGPLGMTRTEWIDRPQKLPDGRALTGLLMNARDMARIGQLMLGRGTVGGVTILKNPAYLELCVQPGSAANPAWGLLWWNNDHEKFMVPFVDKTFDRVLAPSAPRDLIAARGANDHFVGVIPSLNLVVARTGKAADRRGFEAELWKQLLADPHGSHPHAGAC